jgi:DNA polymerase/3'-5' exonuclease PolX
MTKLFSIGTKIGLEFMGQTYTLTKEPISMQELERLPKAEISPKNCLSKTGYKWEDLEINFPITFAKYKAMEIVTLLSPYCQKINIAGSVRRGKERVKDIEIVCLPKTDIHSDLFGGQSETVAVGFVEALKTLGTWIKGKPEGRYMQIELQEGIKLDLFMPQSHDYYRQLTIRTGSSDFAHHTIAAAWTKRGWVGTEFGLRKKSECEWNSGARKYIVKVANPTLPPIWESEVEFFDWLGVKWVEVGDRG